ncbi:NAD(P)H-dependent oxidoreductase [Paenibacillus sp. N1-5-1-14]|uniref:NADPH-dependent FMN reductase n=1 Tax=Paenibacillus radicibacter TaxID=2972488 RepID=UPI0021593190|nr:NADPH-dependent FMN reductase [Paenibacillus radicibacter]MCR8643278.1 NAD(P)H-dependent oxidoreductase [Paenibacillus radicibacter]
MNKIFLISGSAANPAHTTTLIHYIARQLEEHECEVTVWNLQEKPLPFIDPAFHHNPQDHTVQVVREFVQLASEANAFVIGTPNYHNSYTGIVKNSLDLLSFAQFKNKPVGLVANGGGIRSTQPVDQLRIVIRGVLGIAIPMQVVASNSDFIEVQDGYELQDEAIKSRVAMFTEQLVDFTERFKD